MKALFNQHKVNSWFELPSQDPIIVHFTRRKSTPTKSVNGFRQTLWDGSSFTKEKLFNIAAELKKTHNRREAD
jgi:hypothetical protein